VTAAQITTLCCSSWLNMKPLETTIPAMTATNGVSVSSRREATRALARSRRRASTPRATAASEQPTPSRT
jgi:hypothetical protein